MKNLILLTALLVSLPALGQSETEERPVRICETMPKLSACSDMDEVQADRCTQMTVMQLIADEISYPKEAKSMGLEGTVYVSFIVEKDGTVNAIKVLRGVGDFPAALALSTEAIRAVATLPEFTPGLNNKGEAVRVIMVSPVRYLLGE